jgi:hypothetical protein
MGTTFQRRLLTLCLLFVGCLMFVNATWANHSWGNYHWARTSNPFNLKLGDNVSSAWDAYLNEASTDWTKSNVLNTNVVAGATSRRTCKAVTGRVEVCNATYGNNGWLGIAGIYISGSHITKGYVKLNDTYYNTARYNTPAWRRFVTCQEIGHTFGLDHQDENFSNGNLGSCMDYTNDPDGPPSNEHPDSHDFDQLQLIYSHLDNTTTVASAAVANAAPPAIDQIDFAGPAQWGKLVRQSKDGRYSLYMLDFGRGHKVFHFVVWAVKRGKAK